MKIFLSSALELSGAEHILAILTKGIISENSVKIRRNPETFPGL